MTTAKEDADWMRNEWRAIPTSTVGLTRKDTERFLAIADRLEASEKLMACGHPRACVSSSAEGTNSCDWCADVARLEVTEEDVRETQRRYADEVRRKDEIFYDFAYQHKQLTTVLERVQKEAAVLRASVETTAASMYCCGGKVNHGDEHEDDCHAKAALASDAGREYVPKEIADEMASALRTGEGCLCSPTHYCQSCRAVREYEKETK